MRRASHAAQRANPLWELATGAVRTEAGQILAQIPQVVEARGGDYNVTDVSAASFRPLFPSPRPTQESLLLQSSLAAALRGLRKRKEMSPPPPGWPCWRRQRRPEREDGRAERMRRPKESQWRPGRMQTERLRASI